MIKRILLIAGTLMGILLVGGGMWKKNNLCFLLGLTLVIICYLIIRKELRGSSQGKD